MKKKKTNKPLYIMGFVSVCLFVSLMITGYGYGELNEKFKVVARYATQCFMELEQSKKGEF